MLRLTIQNVGPIEQPPQDAGDQGTPHRSYASNDAKRVAWFSEEGEFARGASSWSIRVGEAGVAVDSLARLEVPGRPSSLIQLPLEYHPWVHDGRALLLAFFQTKPILIDPDSREVRELPLEGLFHIASCSPTQPTAFLVTYQRGENASFVAFEKGVRVMERFTLPSTHALAFWLAEGRHVLVLRQDVIPPRLQVYEAGHAQPASEATLSPLSAIPYDEKRFKMVNREGFSLQTSEGFHIGEDLDQWVQAHYVPQERKLLVSVYRPTGEPFKQWDQWMCPARLRWVSVELGY